MTENNNRRRPQEGFSQERNSERTYENSSSPSLPDLAKKEQEHRHQWQDKYLKSNGLSFRMGQIFGLVYNLALLYLVYDLIQDGEKDLAIKIFALNIAIIAFALLVTSIERKILSRKPPRRGGGNSRFKNNNYNRNDRGGNRDSSDRRREPRDNDRNDRR